MTNDRRQYAKARRAFEREIKNLLELETTVAGELDEIITTLADGLTSIATAYAERVTATRLSREQAMLAAEALNAAAAQLGRDPALARELADAALTRIAEQARP